jgi:hypothetical protein
MRKARRVKREAVTPEVSIQQVQPFVAYATKGCTFLLRSFHIRPCFRTKPGKLLKRILCFDESQNRA